MRVRAKTPDIDIDTKSNKMDKYWKYLIGIIDKLNILNCSMIECWLYILSKSKDCQCELAPSAISEGVQLGMIPMIKKVPWVIRGKPTIQRKRRSTIKSSLIRVNISYELPKKP